MPKYISQISKLNWRREKISAQDIALFFRQFATLIIAGVHIIQACTILEKSQEKEKLRLMIFAIKRELLTGKYLYLCMQQFPEQFDQFTCKLIQIGEHTGKLETILTSIASYQEKMLTLKQHIKQTLFYPCIIMATAIIVTLMMLLFIIPKFAELFQAAQQPLPTLTIWIFTLSALLKKYLWLFVCIILITIYLAAREHQPHHLQRMLITTLISLPPIKSVIHKITLARLARHLALTCRAGLPITEALTLTTNTNQNFTNTIRILRNKINAGLQLNQALESNPEFPPLMIQMVKIGEESGNLEYMLDKLGSLLEAEIDASIGRLSQLLEPLIMAVLGVLIGGLVIGMYLPVFQLGHTL